MGSSEDPGKYPAAGPVSTEQLPSVERSAGVVGRATLASRALGLLRDVVIANSFAHGATDVFFLAFTIPNLFRRLVGAPAAREFDRLPGPLRARPRCHPRCGR